jgi:hypothetical protein
MHLPSLDVTLPDIHAEAIASFSRETSVSYFESLSIGITLTSMTYLFVGANF